MAEVESEKVVLENEQKRSGEQFEFDADVPQVMSIIINSVYSSKDLFLRELVSNASDAIAKLLAIKTDLEKEGHKVPFFGEMKIRIVPDKESGTLMIQDNGIGMTKAELHSCLGTIASSGTKKFRQTIDGIKAGGDPCTLIGQFGLGFYSAFLVADEVTVLTKSYHDVGYRWVSSGDRSYLIEECPELTEAGTTVILKLKKGDEEFLEDYKIKELVRKHSSGIRYEIVLVTKEKKKKAEDVVEEEASEKKDEESEKKDEQTEDKEDELEVKEQVINDCVSIWERKFSDIPKEDLVKFYKSISNDYEEYMHAQMWCFEGIMNIKVLLFVPKHKPFNLFSGRPSPTSKNISLFCANVLVCNELSREIVPEWADFIYGAIYSDDFPMNVSREFLQGSSALNLIKKKLPKCILELLKELSRNQQEYEKFYNEFSQFVKLATRMTSDSVQEGFASCLRYELNREAEGVGKTVTLDQYLRIVPESQKQILVLTSVTSAEARESLYLELFRDRYVLLMNSPDDEVLLQGLTKYKDIPFQVISKEGVDGFLGSEDIAEENKPFTEFVAKRIGESVEKVVLARRVSDIPAMIYATKTAVTGTMERLIRSQPKSENDFMLQAMLRGKQILELNLENNLVRRLKDWYDSGELSKAEEYVDFVYSAARLSCGYSVENTANFMKKMYKLLGEGVKE